MVAALALSMGLAYGVTHLVNFFREGSPNAKPILRFRSEGDTYRFKIVQLSDLHLGEASNTPWGPDQDLKTWKLIDTILKAEQPDLIILSGDQVSANDCPNAAEYYKMIGKKLSHYKIPWAMIFGDYDDMDYNLRDGSNGIVPAKYSREDLLEVDMSFQYSLTKKGPEHVFGLTNYLLDIYANDNAAAQIYLFDSGGGSLPKQLLQSQVNWYNQMYGRLPAVAFQHIPTMNMQYNDRCIGFHGEDLQVLDYDPGLVNAMSESTRVYFLAAGHSHGNNYCCPFTMWLQVCLGAHSGYGGYGRWERGARVYELEMKDPEEHAMKWKSWVRLESGEIYDQVNRDDMMTTKGR
jgi:predicted MPP superfamily phosphohydrolase